MKFLESPSTDPRWNLALEQYVFEQMDRSCSYFLLWQNANTIVVGKNQNTVQEINNAFVREEGITVVRRLSGGGAVYHDLGNLNFTFITAAENGEKIDLQMFCIPIVETLRSFGVDAVISGRNDITVDGKKILRQCTISSARPGDAPRDHSLFVGSVQGFPRTASG